ncbi:MAG: PAS domain-containing protein [Chlamydiia bacterium]|nr:PAS domain-containing protein [Chlamydiia bacterium]
MTFRQKIFLSYVGIFLFFVLLMFPFASGLVTHVVRGAMEERVQDIIQAALASPTEEAMIRHLKDRKDTVFFRISLINDDGRVLYDSHAKRLIGPKFTPEYIVDHPEVLEAFEEGSGYHEDYSQLFGDRFAYFARAFDFKGKTFVLRTAFPFKYINELSHDFTWGFAGLITIVLLLFSIINWFTINYLSQPIQEILSAIIPYYEKRESTFPEIHLTKQKGADEFHKLAETFNALSKRIRSQIENLKQERKDKEVLLESLVEGVIAVDPDMNINYVNTQATKFLNLTEKELIGKPFAITQQSVCEELLSNCQQEDQVLTNSIQIQKLFIDLVASPKKDNTGAILVMQDKTNYHKLMEMRKDFIANASHELKTPITIIRGFAETLHDSPDLPKETFKEITDKIVRNSIRMTNLIKDLLMLSDIENIPISHLKACNLHAITTKCHQQLLDKHPDAQVFLAPEDSTPFDLIAEPHLLEMALFNLIENAAKYSTPPAHITITMESNDKGIEWIIRDRGLGIPEEDLEHIFDRFYTVDKAHSRKMGGSGLGLSIVKTIVEKHGGTVTIASTVGVGTTFTLFFPLLDIPLES